MSTRAGVRWLLQGTYHSIGQALAACRVGMRLPDPLLYRHATTLSLPFEGWWVVARGGPCSSDSHSWDAVNQRYAYDFVYAEADCRERRRGAYADLRDYGSYGRRVLACADGRIVALRDGLPDHAPGPTTLPNRGASDLRGNHVVIRHAKAEYSLCAHLQRGSVRVRVGNQVCRGQEIGLCGNSGRSAVPHLHFQFMDCRHFFVAISLPMMFSDFCVRSPGSPETWRIEKGYLSRGKIVAGSGQVPDCL